MRRMYSEKQILELVKNNPEAVVKALEEQDINVNGITSKGIANTGNIANIGDLAVTGDITGKTLEQSEANWSAEITSFVNAGGLSGNLIYGRVNRINGELHIVFIGSITNNTENAVSFYGTSEANVVLPEALADKIYDIARNKVSEAGTNIRISGNYGYGSKDTGSDMSVFQSDVAFIVKHKGVNTISMLFSRPVQMSIPAGNTLYLEGRVSLDLL